MKKHYQLPKKAREDFAKGMKRPSGYFTTIVRGEEALNIFDKNISELILFEQVAGKQLFLIERNKEMTLTYYHYSPGTKTREASIDFSDIGLVENLVISIAWSTSEISMSISISGKALKGIGKVSQRVIRIGSDGKVYKFDGNNDKMKMLYYTRNGKHLVEPTAIEVWEETLYGLDALSTGTSPKGNLYEHVVSNLSIVMLITGFEAYTKRRLLEIEDEGICPREDKVINAFYSSKERSPDIIQKIKKEAKEKSVSVLHLIVSKNIINFQSFEKSKRAYSKAYNIQFGNIGVTNISLEELKKFFFYRHKIIHVHPTTGILNLEKVGIEEQIYSNKELIKTAKTEFNDFIKALHQKTLELTHK